jgi:16S rRNA (guanine966-N2)-methyltransferase
MSLAGVRVLDLYAGTGALGLEALSRGAARATSVESAASACESLRANVAALGLSGQLRLLRGRVEQARPAVVADAPFDLVFADPPYAMVGSGEAARSLAALLEGSPPLLAPSAVVVLEHAKGDEPPRLLDLVITDTRRYGDTALSFYEAPETPKMMESQATRV